MSKKQALVTGGVEGMGLAICKKLIADGYSIITTHFAGEDEAVKSAKNLLPDLELFEVDFSTEHGVLEFVKKIEDRSFDALVNNASYFEFENFSNFDYSIWQKIFMINLTSGLIITHEIKDRINDGGAIVNISTTDSFVGAFASTAWAASKAAINNLTKSFANNLGPRGIRTNTIAVGWVADVQDLGEIGIWAESTKITPLGRMGRSDEIAEVASFLLSSKASFVNGATIVVDGGYTCVDLIGKKEAEAQ